ncbi:hypothetical protein [Cryptosporangium minutisporangium]|uniref:Uncharacterized protein n=1 Tax=Cryptosporangium minutisporangium TaxID=113569 RepID=A0ABP6T6X8_9ACTN
MAQPIDPRVLRPGRVWYAIAAAITGLFVAVGIGVFLYAGVIAISAIPSFHSIHESNGRNVSVALEAGTRYALYVPIGASDTCVLGDGIDSEPLSSRVTVTRNGREWLRVAEITVAYDGAYTYRCEASQSALGESADDDEFGGLVARAFLSVLGLSCLGVVVGGVIALVVGVRRSSHKRRLQTRGPYR